MPVDRYARDDEREILEAWAEASVRYKSLAEFQNGIGRLRVGDTYRREANADDEAEEARQAGHLRVRLLGVRCRRLAELGRSLEFDEALEALNRRDKASWFWMCHYAAQESRTREDMDRARCLVEQLQRETDVSKLPPDARLALAEALLVIARNGEEARSLADSVDPPQLVRDLGPRDSSLDRFGRRIRWVDASGQVMVESRWWTDGLKHMQPYEDDEGW